MLVYVASYPRSGSRLIRLILKQCFGLDCYESLPLKTPADDPPEFQNNWRAWHPPSLDDFIEDARKGEDLFLLRTHGKEAGDRAIYTVRDGRAALASYQRYLRRFHARDYSLRELIKGRARPGRWGDHVCYWLDRPDTLVLRFEHLARTPPLESIATFLNRPILRQFSAPFSLLRDRDPNYFEFGHNGPGIELVERECSKLFWRINGKAMRRVAEVTASSSSPPALPNARA
jgi:hypothetical protein